MDLWTFVSIACGKEREASVTKGTRVILHCLSMNASNCEEFADEWLEQ